MCQECKDGAWFDKDKSFCERQRAQEVSGVAPVAGVRDCTYASAVYSDGAYHLNGATSQQCVASQWVDKPQERCEAMSGTRRPK
jgi:hypothetical protein